MEEDTEGGGENYGRRLHRKAEGEVGNCRIL